MSQPSLDRRQLQHFGLSAVPAELAIELSSGIQLTFCTTAVLLSRVPAASFPRPRRCVKEKFVN